MYFKFKCSNCGNDLMIAEEKAGLKARCPYCNGTVVVPAPPWARGDATQEAAETEAGPPGTDAGGPPSPPRR